jgi:hypothetical protein
MKKVEAGFIESMECLPVKKIPEGPEWTYEVLCCAGPKISYVVLRFMLCWISNVFHGGS